MVLIIIVGMVAETGQALLALHGITFGVGAAASTSVGFGSRSRCRFLEHIARCSGRHLTSAFVWQQLNWLLIEVFEFSLRVLLWIAQSLVRVLLDN